MQATVSEIDRFHGLLKQSLRPSVYGATAIDQPPQFRKTSAWKHNGYVGGVEFSLWSEPMAAQIISENGRPVHQLQEVGDDNAGGWMSWYEKWTRGSVRESKFTLIGAGITFFWGARTHLDQVFRAEWGGSGIEQAAHPHWHADCAVADSNLRISRIHFGMGGWKHTTASNTTSWQVFPNGTDDLREWAIRTVEYCREQLKHYPPS